MPSYLEHNSRRLAYESLDGAAPGVMFLGGYFSDMTGTKAQYLAAQCAAVGRAYLRFDYSGHGQSEGRFRDGCIGDWYADALAMLDHGTAGQQILVGSSMGGWLALKLAVARPQRVRAVIGIAAAPDFTEDLVWACLSPDARARLESEGYILGEGQESLIYTHKLITEARQHLLLRAPINLACPLQLLQGQQDDAVPWQTAERIAAQVARDDVAVTLVPDGDHRLSRPQDLALLWQTLQRFS